MKRRLLNTLAALSLLLALATGGLWVWSFSQVQVAGWTSGMRPGSRENRVTAVSGEGFLACYHDNAWDLRYLPRGWFLEDARTYQPLNPRVAVGVMERQWHGFGYWYSVNSRYGSGAPYTRGIVFPHWSLLLALSILPTLRGWQLLRARRRRSENLCPQCGYDLRATPDRCPECGTPQLAK